MTTPWSSHRRILEFAAAIKSTFEPVIQTHLYPRSQIDIFVQVLQQDGGLLSASMNATTLAIITADIAPSGFVCTVSSGVHSTQSLLDLTTLEENDIPHLTVAVMPLTGTVPHTSRFEEIFASLVKDVHKEMQRAVKQQMGALVHAMGDGSTSSVASVPRGTDDDDNDMRIG